MHDTNLGRRHNLALYKQGILNAVLENHALCWDQKFHFFADIALIMKSWVQVTYNLSIAISVQKLFTAVTSGARQSVVWSYKVE